MAIFAITANGTFMGEYAGIDRQDAITAYVQDAGYADISEAADVIGQTDEEFLADIHCEEVTAQTDAA